MRVIPWTVINYYVLGSSEGLHKLEPMDLEYNLLLHMDCELRMVFTCLKFQKQTNKEDYVVWKDWNISLSSFTESVCGLVV